MTRKFVRVVITQELHVDLDDAGITPDVVRNWHGIGEWDEIDDSDILAVAEARLSYDDIQRYGELNYEEVECMEVEED